MEHSWHRNARATALKTGQIEFYTWAAEETEIEIKTLAEEDRELRELKEKADRITKVKGLGLITAVRYCTKQTASRSLTISGRR
ncbi:hypothetical protein Barb6_02667 [Bacteroidales bacterium Barb6]|nr:hypothetical protein Barb6_02667 [Bacteroidales bacterium Barb6]